MRVVRLHDKGGERVLDDLFWLDDQSLSVERFLAIAVRRGLSRNCPRLTACAAIATCRVVGDDAGW